MIQCIFLCIRIFHCPSHTYTHSDTHTVASRSFRSLRKCVCCIWLLFNKRWRLRTEAAAGGEERIQLLPERTARVRRHMTPCLFMNTNTPDSSKCWNANDGAWLVNWTGYTGWEGILGCVTGEELINGWRWWMEWFLMVLINEKMVERFNLYYSLNQWNFSQPVSSTLTDVH